MYCCTTVLGTVLLDTAPVQCTVMARSWKAVVIGHYSQLKGKEAPSSHAFFKSSFADPDDFEQDLHIRFF